MKKIFESIFSDKFEKFLRTNWSRPTEKNFIALIGKNKDKIVQDDGQGKEYLKALFDKNQNLLRDNCTDEFVDELNRLSSDYQTDSGDDMGMGDEETENDNNINSPEQPEESDDEMEQNPQQKPDNNKISESKDKKMATKKYPASIKLKVDLWNHDASEEEIEKDGTCFVKSGATLKWDDVQKAYKSGEKIVRPGLLHPSMYDVVGEKSELSDKMPSLKKENKKIKKESVYDANEKQKAIQKQTKPQSETPGFNTKTKKTWAINGPGEMSESESLKEVKLFPEERAEIERCLNIIKTKKVGSERRAAIQKIVDKAREVSGHPITSLQNALLSLDFIEPNISSGSQNSLKERVGMDAEDISVRIFPTKGININREDLTKILNVLNTTYSSRPKIKGKPEATELTVPKFPLSQLVNLRGDLKTISPNLDVDSVTLPNVSNNVPVDEIEESSRAENMTRNGHMRVFEDENLEDIEKIVNESYDELVNFHKDHVDVVDSWKDIQNKTKTSHTIIQEDPSEGPQEHNGDADIEDPFDDIVNITPSSKTIIETEGAGQKKVAKDIDKRVKAEQGREKSNEKKKTDQKTNYYSKLNKKNEDNKKLSGASPTSLEENPSKGIQMGDKKAKEEYPWEEYGIKSEWIEEAPTQRTNFSFQELNNQKKSKEIANNKASELADKNNSLVWKIKQKIKQLEIQLQDVYMEQESDKNVLDDSTNGQNPAVIKYGRKIQGIENAINKLQNKLKSLTVNETVQNPTLTDMQHNVLDEDKSGDVWDATSTLIPHESERGGVKGNPKPIPTEVPWNKKKLKKEAKEIVGTPEGGKKGIDDRVKEQEDKDESLEETEKCYCNKEEWEEKLKELYKGKSVKFEDELYAIVAYVGDDEVGEWKDDTASGGTGKIWNSMFDTLEMIKEGNEYSVTGVVGGMQPSSDLLEYEDDEDWSPKDDYKTDMGDDAVTDECPKCHHDAYNEQRNGTMSCSYCGYSNLDECEGPILHEDMTTADMAVPDKSIELQKRKIEEIDRFFSEFVQKSCNVRGFINEGKFNLEGYMNSRPYSFQKIIFEAFNKEFYKEDIALDQVMMDEGNEWVDPHADDEDSYLTDPEFYKESDDMFPDVGNEEEIHDHLRINETDMEEENIENFKRALHAVKRGIIDLEQQFDGTDANEVSKLIQQAKMKFNLSDSMERDLRVDIFDWRNKRG